VLVSKEPHCLQQLIDDAKAARLHGEIAVVLSNHPDLKPLAEAAGLKFDSYPADDMAKHSEWLAKSLKQHNVELIVLARYMRIVSPSPEAAWSAGVAFCPAERSFMKMVACRGPIVALRGSVRTGYLFFEDRCG
jgi:formyltetrahydrofolate hydrolase